MKGEIKDVLSSGQRARLIPTVADSKKEERATSSLLAAFMVVPEYTKEVLGEAGAPTGKKIDTICYTEVCFKTPDKSKNCRPDGLIVITSHGKKWSALVESKVGNAELQKEQIEEYLDLAKDHGINAVITISNQFAIAPSHHPIKVAKQKLRNVELFHFSWLSLKSSAIIITDNKKIDDPEQAYILSELVRYLDHDSSGVSALTKMSNDWKEVCLSIQQQAVLSRTSSIVENSVVSWQQLIRHLALELSMKIGQPVSLSLTKSRLKDPDANLAEDCSHVAEKNYLEADFEVPNAAARIHFHADFLRRTINFSMKLDAPKDRVRATASINWLTKQLRGKDQLSDLTLRTYWPRRTPMTSTPLLTAIESPDALLPPGVSDLPTYLEIVRVVDLMAKFKGVRNFVEECSTHLPQFYHDVGQHLSKWVPKAPQVKEKIADQNTVPTFLSGTEDIIEISESNLPNPT